MKKKIVFVFIGLTLIAPFLFSAGFDISGQVSPIGFMNFSVWTKYKEGSFPDALKEAEKNFLMQWVRDNLFRETNSFTTAIMPIP